jgi:hypothetical protein
VQRALAPQVRRPPDPEVEARGDPVAEGQHPRLLVGGHAQDAADDADGQQRRVALDEVGRLPGGGAGQLVEQLVGDGLHLRPQLLDRSVR